MIQIVSDLRNLPKIKRPGEGPNRIISLRDNGTIVLDKGRYSEIKNIRRIRPFPQNKGADVAYPSTASSPSDAVSRSTYTTYLSIRREPATNLSTRPLSTRELTTDLLTSLISRKGIRLGRRSGSTKTYTGETKHGASNRE